MGKETNKKILNAADHNQQNAVDKAKEKALELQQQLLSQQQENADLQEQMGDDEDIGIA